MLTYNTPGLYRAVAAMMLVERWRKRDWLVYVGYNSVSPKSRTMADLNRMREITERYLHDDADGDLDAEKWGLAMPPGDVTWLLAEFDRVSEQLRNFSAAHTVPPTGFIEHDEAMARAREARALYGKPSKATRVRIDRGDFIRVSGEILCETCQVAYSDHDPVIGFPWLRHACDGRLLKP